MKDIRVNVEFGTVSSLPQERKGLWRFLPVATLRPAMGGRRFGLYVRVDTLAAYIFVTFPVTSGSKRRNQR